MLKSQTLQKKLKRRRSAVGTLLSGLGWIAADLHSYGTLLDETLKPWLKFWMPNILPTLPTYRISHSVAPPIQSSSSQLLFILEIIFMPVILGKQMQGRGPWGSTSCSKMLATFSQLVFFCTGEILRLHAILYSLMIHFTVHITSIYCRTCKLLPPE